jgi:glycine dehydrogenase subunit 2
VKYNPKFTERIAAYSGFADLHPLLPQLRGGGLLTQGALEVLYQMDILLRKITGMAGFTLQPMAGAHGELTGMMIMSAYHRDRGNRKSIVLAPDSAHGTNPASAAIAGYRVVSVPTNRFGTVDMDAFERLINPEVAGVMMTCPNTLGLFEPQIRQICELVHSVDGLAYYDGANLNAIVGKARPADFGFDIMHINLHKTFATPHGGGGPGAGPVGVREGLQQYLPVSIVVKRDDGTYALEYNRPKSIGYVAPFYGNFGVILKAYAYILMLGREGLVRVAENAVLNANYIRIRLKDHYDMPYPGLCKHECVLTPTRQMLANDIHAIDIAKALIDRGFHPPTIYFPTIVKEAMMIEPTETEAKETLDRFIEAMIEIADLAITDPQQLKDSPKTTVVCRPDEVLAAKNLDIAFLQ